MEVIYLRPPRENKLAFQFCQWPPFASGIVFTPKATAPFPTAKLQCIYPCLKKLVLPFVTVQTEVHFALAQEPEVHFAKDCSCLAHVQRTRQLIGHHDDEDQN